MLRSSRKVAVKTYKLPTDKKTFKLTMATERRILGVQFDGSQYLLLAEEPEGSHTRDFDFTAVTVGEVFDKSHEVSYLGSYSVLINLDDDRPGSEVRYLYGKTQGESMGGAL